jgi:hypothetical protein
MDTTVGLLGIFYYYFLGLVFGVPTTGDVLTSTVKVLNVMLGYNVCISIAK